MRRFLRARLGQRDLRARPAGGEDRLRAPTIAVQYPAPAVNSAPSAVLCTPPVPVSEMDGK